PKDESSDETDANEDESEVQSVQNFYIQALSVSPDGGRAAVGSGQQTFLVDLDSGGKLCEIKHSGYSQSLTFLSEDRIVDSSATIYDVETGEKDGNLPKRIFGQYLQSIKVNPKNENLVAASQWNQGVILYDMERKKRIDLEMPGKPKSFMLCEFSGNGKLIAGATYGYNTLNGNPESGEIYVWEVSSGKLKNKYKTSTGQLMGIRFSSNNETLYSKAQGEFGVASWDLSVKEQTQENMGLTSPPQKIAFSPDGERVLAAASVGAGVFYDLETGEPGRSVPSNQAWHLRFDKSGQHALVGANYNQVTVFNCDTNRSKAINVRSYQRPTLISQLGSFLTRKKKPNRWENFAISDISISEDQEHVFASLRGQRNFRLEKFDISTGKSVEQFRFRMKDYWETKEAEDENGAVQYVHSQLQWMPKTMTTSPDGSVVAILDDDMNLYLIDAESGDELFDLGDQGEAVQQSKLNFINSGARLLMTQPGKIKMFDVDSGEAISNSISANGLQHFGLSQDGSRMIVSGHSQFSVYDSEEFEKICSHKIKGGCTTVALSEDGSKVAIGKANCQFEVWDLDVLN
ncbi:MAG: hypothetical protein AAGA30_10660, partial [Planctomycetota bacterium]